MTEALLKTGKHTVTAITRADSRSTLPDSVAVKKVDYNEPETLVSALRGQRRSRHHDQRVRADPGDRGEAWQGRR